MLYLQVATFWCQNMAGNLVPIGRDGEKAPLGGPYLGRVGEKAPLGGPYLPVGSVFVLPHNVWWRGPMWDKGKDAEGITVDRVSVSCSTSTQICGIWYLPRFLFRKGH